MRAKPFVVGTKALTKLLWFLSSMLPASVVAQQVPLLNHYFYNRYLVNPAAAGTKDYLRIASFYRQQWSGIPGAPATQALYIDGPLDEKTGFGFSVLNDESDIMTRLSALVAASHRIRITDHQDLSFGLAVGILRNQIDFDKIRGDVSDPGLLANGANKTTLEGSAGIGYRVRNFKVGFASEQLLSRSITYVHEADQRTLAYRLVRHYALSAEYQWSINHDLEFQPMLLVRNAQGLPSQWEANAQVTYKRNMWTNLAYRHNAGLATSIGFDIQDKIVVGYTYEYPLSNLRAISGGSHEVMLSVKLFALSAGKSTVNQQGKGTRGDDTQLKVQYEQIDALAQQNEELNNKIKDYKKTLDSQQDEIVKLKKSLEASEIETRALIDQLKVDLKTEQQFDNSFDYYIVIGAVKALDQAKLFQRAVVKRSQLTTNIIQNDNKTWYFIYVDLVKSRSEAVQKLDSLPLEKIEDVITGNPWVYKTKKR